MPKWLMLLGVIPLVYFTVRVYLYLTDGALHLDRIWTYPFNLIWVVPLGFLLGGLLTPDYGDREGFSLIGAILATIFFAWLASTGALNA